MKKKISRCYKILLWISFPHCQQRNLFLYLFLVFRTLLFFSAPFLTVEREILSILCIMWAASGLIHLSVLRDKNNKTWTNFSQSAVPHPYTRKRYFPIVALVTLRKTWMGLQLTNIEATINEVWRGWENVFVITGFIIN